MAEKSKQPAGASERQSRKEVLLARRLEKQTRQVRIAVLGIVAFLVLVIGFGVINELLIKPGQPVASVRGVEISLRDWQDRVRLQRAQLIISLEDLAEALNNDIGQVQQFAQQQLNLLLDPETLGQFVLDQMIEEELIRLEAQARGISIVDADVDGELEASFNYFGGEVPTAFPTSTGTPIPTPSLTPIPTMVITEVVPTNTPVPTFTPGPTNTPRPTSTPVSLESYQESLAETFDRIEALSGDVEAFRELVRAQLYSEALQEALVSETNLNTRDMHSSFFYVSTNDQEEAEGILEQIDEADFISIWNSIRSTPLDPESESSAFASELLWRTEADVTSLFGENVARDAFLLPLGVSSKVVIQESADGETPDRYLIIQVSGREERDLTEATIRSQENQLLADWVESQKQIDVEIFERWRTNVPRRPLLDPRFLVAPTPAPATPTLEQPEVVPTEPQG